MVFFYINGVLAAIDFDDQFSCPRDEIADEGTDRKLAVEADAGNLASTQLRPKRPFGGRGVEA